jgi:hypothetical protein
MANLLEPKLVGLRLNLITEELKEGMDAEIILNDPEQDGEAKEAAIIEIFDSLVDVAVVTIGTACAFGLHLDSSDVSQEMFEELQLMDDIFQPLAAELTLLIENLMDLNKFPSTKSYLVSTILRNLQNLLDYCIGIADSLNFPFELGFLEVHASNMSKLGEDGLPIYREDGKILKGPNYFKPNLKKVLDDYLAQLVESA